MKCYFFLQKLGMHLEIVIRFSRIYYRSNNLNSVLSHTYCSYSSHDIHSSLVGPLQLVHRFWRVFLRNECIIPSGDCLVLSKAEGYTHNLKEIPMGKHLWTAFFFFFIFSPKSITLLTHIQCVIHYYLFWDKMHKQGLSLRTIAYETVLYNESFTSRLRKLLIPEESWWYFVFDWLKEIFFSQFMYRRKMPLAVFSLCMLHHHKHYCLSVRVKI